MFKRVSAPTHHCSPALWVCSRLKISPLLQLHPAAFLLAASRSVLQVREGHSEPSPVNQSNQHSMLWTQHVFLTAVDLRYVWYNSEYYVSTRTKSGQQRKMFTTQFDAWLAPNLMIILLCTLLYRQTSYLAATHFEASVGRKKQARSWIWSSALCLNQRLCIQLMKVLASVHHCCVITLHVVPRKDPRTTQTKPLTHSCNWIINHQPHQVHSTSYTAPSL